MARQVLENGVVLPAEYSDDWYDDMTSNLTKLDDVIGSDSEKLSSADVGAAALSNNYNDLDNLPTIPTVNDATLTIQKNGVNVQTFTANASSNVTCNITVPTKTSDLTNDSNFVDTSNAAVSSGITSAKVTDYDTHIADTDIHVTTADKTKWNNGVSQSYVFRYSSTALVASSTNSNALLDNTDNLKVGDKVIDSDGVLFSITTIDTANSTFTIGSALIDLALDGNVVHTSGNETVGGSKTFLSSPIIYNPDTSVNDYLVLKNPKATIGSTTDTGSQRVVFQDKNGTPLGSLISSVDSNGWTYTVLEGSCIDSQSNTITQSVRLKVTNTGAALLPSNNNSLLLGSASAKWSSIYATNYYYGSNNVEFSTKFVTTDTNQTISGAKTFSSNVNVYNSDSATDTANIILKNSKAERGSTTNIGEQTISFLDKDNAQLGQIKCEVDTGGVSTLTLQCTNSSNSSSGIRLRRTSTGTFLQPVFNNGCNLGTLGYRWYDTQTRAINGVEPSSLSLPSGNASDVIDISSYLVNLDGTTNSYTAPANGWISIAVVGTAIAIVSSSWSDSRLRESSGNVRMLYPVLKNETLDISVIGTTLAYARFIPCQGNV